MSIEVIRPGILSSLQDAGRLGYRSMAVGPGGVMDDFAWLIGNSLAGNPQPMTSLEYFHPGPVLRFNTSALISFTGPGCTGLLDGNPVPGWHPLLVASGSVLELMPSPNGRCGYLHIHGGFSGDSFLLSCSTNLVVGAGGFHGKKLATGDRLELNTSQPDVRELHVLGWSIPARDFMLVYGEEKHISCLPAPETELLGDDAMRDFSQQAFTLGSNSNRMGYRLKGPVIKMEKPIELVSSPVDQGVIQLLPDGQLIVLMADHQTTGGYPRIACVVGADLPRLVQAPSNRDIYFSWCQPAAASRIRKERSSRIAAIRTACLLNIREYL